MQSDQKLYTTIFTDSNQQSVNQVPFFIKEYDIKRKQVFSSAQSSELLILGHYVTIVINYKNCVSIIDMITRDCTIEFINMTNQGCIVTAVGIGYYNNYVIVGSQTGTLHMMMIINSVKQFDVQTVIEIRLLSKFKIQNVFATNGDLVIVVCINGIKFFYATQLSKLVQNSKQRKYIVNSSEIETVSELFPVGISASAFCHLSNQLIIALGDSSIRVYTFIGEDVEGSLKRSKTYFIEQMEIINKLSVSNDGRLLAISQCKLINSMEYRIDIMDLKRKGKVIKKYNYKDAGEVYDMKFFPVSNKLFVTVNTGQYYIVDIDVFGDDRMYQTSQTELTKNIYPMSQYQEFPNFLQISENGIVSILAFDSPKIDCLMQMPFLYFVEMRLQEMFDYKPLLQYYFQSSFYIGFTGIDKKNAQSQILMLNGEQYFEPLYDGVIRMSEFKQFYKQDFQKRIKYRRKRYELPSQIASWALNNIKKSQFQKLQQFEAFSQAPIMKKNESENYQQENRRFSKPQTKKKKEKMKKLEQLFDFSQDTDEKMVQHLGESVEIYIRQYNDMKLSDDRYILISKLILNLQYQNLTMLMLGNCSLLFDVRLQFKEYIIDMINRVDRLTYLDLSNDNITFEDIKKITRLTQLKYLDLSCNHLGDQQKKPMVKQKAKFQNLDIQEEEHLNQDEEFSFYKLLFQKIPIINLRNNNFTDQEGVNLILSLEDNEDIRVLDLSGNLLFSEQTKFQLETLIRNKPKQLKATQTLIIEFNDEISEISMKQLTKLMIEKQGQQIDISIGKEIPEQVNESIMNFYLYVVNSNQNYYWDQSLLQLYERMDDAQTDEIRSCVYVFFAVIGKIFVDFYDNLQTNFIACLKQCFCSVYFLQKYIVCCYCVFLQSDYGSWITHLLGIKTADYEYNNKKDDLKKDLENNKYPLNFIFWVNFIAFYFICIFVPIFFVLKCSGHQWTGHFIYCGYAFFVCLLELKLAKICISHEITHHEFSTGPEWKKALHFGKDLFLSQMAKFDVYSDICFITTVMTCDDTNVIGYLAIAIMVITLGTTMYHLLHLLLSRQDGDENYIDYLCNYCSFVEIHLVGSLLEKWTIQNTSNFLWMKGIPNRVYAATFRTFAEDLPQFLLQVIYLYLNPNKKGIEILLLSLASSTVSIIISITKSLTITKANRINDQIMMNEVKNKLGLIKDPADPKLKDELIQFLHDYYENFDGEEQVQELQYGIADLKHMRKPNESATNIRTVKGTKQTNKIQIQKGVSMLVEHATTKQQPPIMKNPTLALDYEKLDFFEPYLFLINSAQAKLIQKLYSRGLIQHQVIAQVLLELEITDYVDSTPMFQNEMEIYNYTQGSFIESLEVQIVILETIYTKLIENLEKDISILDLGCGSGFTATAILKLCEKLKQKGKFEILCIDHIPQILQRAKDVIELGFEDFLENKFIKFEEYDCRDDLMGLGQFDIVNYGFAVTDVQKPQRLLLENGLAIVPVATLPQDHDYFLVTKDSVTDIKLKAQAGQLQAKELQYPDFYQYYQIEKGDKCDNCDNVIRDQGQFYSPWMRKYFCIVCGKLDDQEEDQNQFKILSNLVFIPTTATEDDMKRVSSYKFGHNLFPKKNQTLTKRHAIDCHPCQREKGEENDFDPLPRFICLNCRPGKFDGQHLDICYECAECFIDDEKEYERDLKLNYLSGHKSSHLLLKIHFYYDYNNY